MGNRTKARVIDLDGTIYDDDDKSTSSYEEFGFGVISSVFALVKGGSTGQVQRTCPPSPFLYQGGKSKLSSFIPSFPHRRGRKGG
jgi:hypothetical protein